MCEKCAEVISEIVERINGKVPESLRADKTFESVLAAPEFPEFVIDWYTRVGDILKEEAQNFVAATGIHPSIFMAATFIACGGGEKVFRDYGSEEERHLAIKYMNVLEKTVDSFRERWLKSRAMREKQKSSVQ